MPHSQTHILNTCTCLCDDLVLPFLTGGLLCHAVWHLFVRFGAPLHVIIAKTCWLLVKNVDGIVLIKFASFPCLCSLKQLLVLWGNFSARRGHSGSVCTLLSCGVLRDVTQVAACGNMYMHADTFLRQSESIFFCSASGSSLDVSESLSSPGRGGGRNWVVRTCATTTVT